MTRADCHAIGSPALYPYPPAPRYTLARDGVAVFEGTEHECWAYLHRVQSGSVDYALRHAGYTMTPATAGEGATR